MMYLQVAIGFVLLMGGAEFLVRGAVAVSKRLGVSPLIIGLTVVAFGTSAPELVVSLDAALSGVPGLALGNIVGSNIANILLILGATGLVLPILTKPHDMKPEAWVLLATSLVFAGLCWRGEIALAGGGVLLAMFLAFLGYSYWRKTRQEAPQSAEFHGRGMKELSKIKTPQWISWLSLIGGIAGVVFGADVLVEGGVAIARMLGISEEVIGLTLFAVGTSLPELAASLAAAARGHAELTLGNVVGSNLFNILGVGGTVAVVTPLAVPAQIAAFDLWVMVGATAVLFAFLLAGWRIGRILAAVLLLVYVAYIAAQAYGVAALLPGLV